MSAFLQELNDVQKQAVTTTEGPVMVIAGPGSGKTRVLTYRIAYLLEKGVSPKKILSLTFTNKAAREMKERIEKVMGSGARQLWAGTFHSIFARILRIEAGKIGYPSNFTIYDSDDSKSVISGIIKEMSLDPKTYNANAIRSRISSAKSNLITPKLYIKNDDIMVQDQANRRPHLHKIYDTYVKRCYQAGAMDFDDLLLQLFRLLQENPEGVKDKYRDIFEYVLVDEFQDTNFLQYSILKQLKKYPGSNENLCIVGDDAQSIYAFRGATIDNILNFEKDFPNTKVFKLEQNYRSTNHIVQAANEVIQFNKKQIQKKIWTEQHKGEKIKVIKALSDSEEGRRIADAILEHKTRHHIPNSEIAILYRTNAQSRVFEEHLRRHNIPYKIFGGLSFYQRKEIKDLLAYLRLAVNPSDNEAFKRVVNQPKRGIGKSTMDKVLLHAGQNDMTVWEAVQKTPLSNGPANKLLAFMKLIQRFGKIAATTNAYDAVLQIYKGSGLHDLLKNDTSIEGQSRLENVSALLDGVQEFIENDEVLEGQDNDDRSLAAYLQNIALLTDLDSEEEGDDYVTLMSVHAAKGLEFESVFIVGLEENLFPSFMALQAKEDIDEERRLFYVAITRAKKHLTLSFANSRYQYGQMRYNDPSRFLEEISDEWIDTPTIRSGSGGRAAQVPKARVTGGPRPQGVQAPSVKKIDPSTFKPSPMHKLQEGQKVLHLKFGEGKILKLDGSNDKKVATIHFHEIDKPERRIMLKFAKLQILDA
jgi:DNA helicase-2/ATP-dependent DNA helicase PcrA